MLHLSIGPRYNRSATIRASVTFVIAFMVASSPIIVFVNPAPVSAATNTKYSNRADDSSTYHSTPRLSDTSQPSSSATPSTVAPSSPLTSNQGNGGGDFTTQAALSGVWARQTNNIVGAQSYYDIIFVTSTTGTIKFIDITFPPGTLIGAPPRLVEREGIGHGNAVLATSTTISYTVLNPVSVPEGTKIRLEFFNLVNPTLPSTGYKVTVTTKDEAGTVIDGPTLSNGLNMKQISTGQIADSSITSTKPAESFMKRVTLTDTPAGNARGWNPNGAHTTFSITEPSITNKDQSFPIIVLNSGTGDALCAVTQVTPQFTSFFVFCSVAPQDGSELGYIVATLPEHIVS